MWFRSRLFRSQRVYHTKFNGFLVSMYTILFYRTIMRKPAPRTRRRYGGGPTRLRRATMRDIRRIHRQNGGVLPLLVVAQSTPALLTIGNLLVTGIGNLVWYTMNVADGVDKVKHLFDLGDFVGSFVEPA